MPTALNPLQVIGLTTFRVLTLIAVPACLLTTLAYFFDYPAQFAQLSPFRLQYAVLLAAHTLFCFSQRRRRWAAFFATFATFNFCAILAPGSLRPSTPPSVSGERVLRIVYANVQTENTDPAPLLALIAAESPDLIALTEINQRWADDLTQALRTEYPHHLIRSREDNFGAALFSRRPFTDAATRFFSAAEVPSLSVNLQHAEQTVSLLLTHPVPPGDADGTRWRNEHLRALAEWSPAPEARTPAILLGDFNATPWCPPLRSLLRHARLKSAAAGHIHYPATWPVQLPHMRIPIDHVLINPELACTSYQIGPDIGSDHYPLVVKLTLPESDRVHTAIAPLHPVDQ